MSLNEGERKKALAEARRRVFELETPEERIARFGWFETTKIPLMKVAINLGVYRKLAALDGQAIALEELAKQAGAAERLLRRVLRVLAADNQVAEHGVDLFAANEYTKVAAKPEWEGLLTNCIEAHGPLAATLPAYLSSRSYPDPASLTPSPWMEATGASEPYFRWLHLPGNEAARRSVEQHMAAKNLYNPPWVAHESASDILGLLSSPSTTPQPSDVLWVDIGGALGGDILQTREHVRRTAPEAVGRYVLQDLRATIEAAAKQHGSELPADVELMPYDMFTSQPVQGARVYYLHQVLHDWPHEKCVEVLRNQATAMVKGHSRVLVHEIMVPDQGADWVQAGIDTSMMVVHASSERTRREWEQLYAEAGMRLEKVWDCGGNVDKIMELVLI